MKFQPIRKFNHKGQTFEQLRKFMAIHGSSSHYNYDLSMVLSGMMDQMLGDDGIINTQDEFYLLVHSNGLQDSRDYHNFHSTFLSHYSRQKKGVKTFIVRRVMSEIQVQPYNIGGLSCETCMQWHSKQPMGCISCIQGANGYHNHEPIDFCQSFDCNQIFHKIEGKTHCDSCENMTLLRLQCLIEENDGIRFTNTKENAYYYIEHDGLYQSLFEEGDDNLVDIEKLSTIEQEKLIKQILDNRPDNTLCVHVVEDADRPGNYKLIITSDFDSTNPKEVIIQDQLEKHGITIPNTEENYTYLRDSQGLFYKASDWPYDNGFEKDITRLLNKTIPRLELHSLNPDCTTVIDIKLYLGELTDQCYMCKEGEECTIDCANKLGGKCNHKKLNLTTECNPEKCICQKNKED